MADKTLGELDDIGALTTEDMIPVARGTGAMKRTRVGSLISTLLGSVGSSASAAQRSSNLSDLSDKAAALTNLGFPARSSWVPGKAFGVGSDGNSITMISSGGSASEVMVDDYILDSDPLISGTSFRDALPAFNRAYQAGKMVRGKARTYHTSGPINFTADGNGFIGEGRDSTTIECHNLNTAVIFGATSLTGLTVSHCTIRHTIPAQSGNPAIDKPTFAALGSGAHGVDFGRIGSTFELANVRADWNFDGFRIAGTDYSFITNCLGNYNKNAGFHCCGDAANSVLQWYVMNCQAGRNQYQGFFWESGPGSGIANCGTFTGCATFDNGGPGMAFSGSTARPLNAVRIEGGFFGGAGDPSFRLPGQPVITASEIFLDTYSSHHIIKPTFIELSHGHGIEITANNEDVNVSGGGVINGMDLCGIYTAAEITNISDMAISNNGLRQQQYLQNGVTHAGSGRLMMTGVTTRKNTLPSQAYGLATTSDSVMLMGCDLTGNGVSAVTTSAAFTSANSSVCGCLPVSINMATYSSTTVNGNLKVVGNIEATGDVKSQTLHVLGDSAFTGTINALGDMASSGQIRFSSAGPSTKIDAGNGGITGGTFYANGDISGYTVHVRSDLALGGNIFGDQSNSNVIGQIYANGLHVKNIDIPAGGDIFKGGVTYANP